MNFDWGLAVKLAFVFGSCFGNCKLLAHDCQFAICVASHSLTSFPSLDPSFRR